MDEQTDRQTDKKYKHGFWSSVSIYTNVIGHVTKNYHGSMWPTISENVYRLYRSRNKEVSRGRLAVYFREYLQTLYVRWQWSIKWVFDSLFQRTFINAISHVTQKNVWPSISENVLPRLQIAWQRRAISKNVYERYRSREEKASSGVLNVYFRKRLPTLKVTWRRSIQWGFQRLFQKTFINVVGHVTQVFHVGIWPSISENVYQRLR